jgi:hypothetical protein
MGEGGQGGEVKPGRHGTWPETRRPSSAWNLVTRPYSPGGAGGKAER